MKTRGSGIQAISWVWSQLGLHESLSRKNKQKYQQKLKSVHLFSLSDLYKYIILHITVIIEVNSFFSPNTVSLCGPEYTYLCLLKACVIIPGTILTFSIDLLDFFVFLLFCHLSLIHIDLPALLILLTILGELEFFILNHLATIISAQLLSFLWNGFLMTDSQV